MWVTGCSSPSANKKHNNRSQILFFDFLSGRGRFCYVQVVSLCCSGTAFLVPPPFLSSFLEPSVGLFPYLLVLGGNQVFRGSCNSGVDLCIRVSMVSVGNTLDEKLTESHRAKALCKSPSKSTAWGNHSLAPLILTLLRAVFDVGSLWAESSSKYDLTAMPRAQSTSFKNGKLGVQLVL